MWFMDHIYFSSFNMPVAACVRDLYYRISLLDVILQLLLFDLTITDLDPQGQHPILPSHNPIEFDRKIECR
jgi:hypothetical protein